MNKKWKFWLLNINRNMKLIFSESNSQHSTLKVVISKQQYNFCRVANLLIFRLRQQQQIIFLQFEHYARTMHMESRLRDYIKYELCELFLL